MKVKRAYKRSRVNAVDVAALRARVSQSRGSLTAVGLDVAKEEIVACVRWGEDDFERPWSVRNPDEIGELLKLLAVWQEEKAGLVVALESTGTYGEAVRRALTEACIPVHRVSGKATHDYAEIFDGVPSGHDGKDAAMVGELAFFGKGTPWPYEPEPEHLGQIRYLLLSVDAHRKEYAMWLGRLEGLVAKHWPELGDFLALNSLTSLRLLRHYVTPARVAADPRAAEKLAKWGGTRLKAEKIEAILASAGNTRGAVASAAQASWLKRVVASLLSRRRLITRATQEVESLISEYPELGRYASIGASTLAAILVHLGDPREFHSGGALLKAAGLNLKERSSGKRQGQLAISKRGSAEVRRWLFFWALRAVQRPELQAWYENFIQVGKNPSSTTSRKTEHRRMKAIVALMRKLLRGLRRAMVLKEDFCHGKLFAPPKKSRRPRKRKRRLNGSTAAITR